MTPRVSALKLPPRALSVRQPWAWAIIHAGKDVENRDWSGSNPNLTFRGPLAIHAASGMTQDEYHSAARTIHLIHGHCPPPAQLVRGAIIGMVEVYGIARTSEQRRDPFTSPWFFGPVGLKLMKARACEPIPCRGKLGVFGWERDDTNIVTPARWMMATALAVSRAQPSG